MGGLPFLPSLPLPLSPFSLPPASSLPSLPLEVGPILRLGSLGEGLSSPSGSGRSPATKRYLVNFRLKNVSGKCNEILSTYSRKSTNKYGKLKA